MRQFFFLLQILLVPCAVIAQANCEMMFTSVKTADGIIISSHIPGDGPENADIPIITKISPEGGEIWRLEDSLAQPYYNVYDITIDCMDNEFLYANVLIHDGDESIHINTQIWKIALATGAVIWKSEIVQCDNELPTNTYDYKNNKLLYFYGLRDNIGGVSGGYKIVLMDKANGSVELVREFTGPVNLFYPILDRNLNLLYATHSAIPNTSAITKLNGINFNSVVWQKSYTGVPSMANLNDVDLLMIDKNNNLYASGSGDMFRINIENGDEIWQINGLNTNNTLSDYKFRDDYLYISSRHIYVGSVYSSFLLHKINTITGNTVWSSVANAMTPVGEPIQYETGDEQAALSFDLDCSGDIFATGYCGSANYAPAAWGSMKIAGDTGEMLSNITITSNAQTVNTQSVGYSSHVFNDHVVFLGNLQYSAQNAVRTYVSTDTNLTGVLSKSYFCIVDSDGDSIADVDEDVDGIGFIENDNNDNDAFPNYLDPDDDGDGIPTILEDANGDGNPLNDFSDPDNPTLPDYLNPAIGLGVDEHSSVIGVSPNPTQNSVQINHPADLQITDISLYDITGALVLHCKTSCEVLDLTDFASGIYILKITSQNDSIVKKIIKQ